MHRGVGVAIAAVGLALGTATVSAGSPVAGQHISGSFQELPPDVPTSFHMPPTGSVVVVNHVHPIQFEGSLTGYSTSIEHTVLQANGNFETHNTELFTGTLTTDQGLVGSGSLTINFTATGTCVFNPDGSCAGTFTAHFQIIGGSGGLAGVRGEGTSVGVPGAETGFGTYSGTLSG